MILVFLSFGYSWWLYPHIGLNKPLKGRGYFVTEAIKPYQSAFSKGILYVGKLRSFETAERTYRNLPCSFAQTKNRRPKADHAFIIEGTLTFRKKGQALLKISKRSRGKKQLPLAEGRYQMKQALRKMLESRISDKNAQDFLCAMLTGQMTNRQLRYQFNKWGLSHILAISGFHFTLLLGFSFFVLGFFIPRNCIHWLLLLVANGFFFFIGPSPAVMRAWLMAQFFLLGKILSRRCFVLNFLGFSLFVELIFDPLVLTHLGFQLSFLACGSILLFYRPIEKLLSKILVQRSKEEVEEFSKLDQLGYFISATLRKAFALSLSANIAVFPLLLYYFHTFPLMSLIYNLFYPFFISISIFLLLFSLFFHWVPYLSVGSYFLCEMVTTFSLNIIKHAPSSIAFVIQSKSLTINICVIYLTILFTYGIYFSKNNKNKEPVLL